MQGNPRDEQRLISTILDPQIADDPLAFVLTVFPWGKENTPLARFKGPKTWQRDELLAIKDHLQSNHWRMENGIDPTVFKSATSSGRGIGKSALTSWLTMWFMSTVWGGTCVVSANTDAQLKSKTFAELGKWHTLALNHHWFEKIATKLKPAPWFEKHLKEQMKIDTQYYYAEATLWSEENPDAFAGAHSQYGVMLIFDEASGIPIPIWDVSRGFFTEKTAHRFWFAFSNPRRNSGAFFECFHKDRKFWKRASIDSRTVEDVDKAEFNEIIEKYGEDSDPARVEVRGLFPRQGDRQFISREEVQNAIERELIPDPGAPLIMGVDPARFGSDSTVIRFRQGRNGKVLKPVKLRGADNMTVANECAALINKYNPDAVCVDAGNGTGIIDRLREMGYKVHEVWFGSKSSEEQWANHRTELWGKMRAWLSGAVIDNDPELFDDLTGPEYKYMGSGDKQMLESKEDMKKRGLASPDDGDALACTFSVNVARRDVAVSKVSRQARIIPDMDYSVLG